MQKRRILLSIISVVLVLMLALCVFVACNDDNKGNQGGGGGGDDTPTTISITFQFDDGVTPDKVVTIGYNTALQEEDIPEASKAGHIFNGWFNGLTKIRANQKFTEDITAIADYSLKKIKVTFIDGENKTSVTVDYGTKVAEEDFPEVESTPTHRFLGWVIKDTNPAQAFTKDTVVNFEEDIEVVADIDADEYDVIFKLNADDEEDYKKVTVEHGSVIADADLPVNPTTDDPTMKFAGWFEVENEEGETAQFDKTEAITAAKTYVAKFVKAKYVVTFKFAADEDREDKVVYLEFDENGNVSLDDLDIPSDAVKTLDGRNFMGFYTSENVKAEANMTLTADTIFEAYYVGVVDYKGVWVDETNKLVAYFDNSKVSVGELLEEKTFTFANGVITYKPSFGTAWTFKFFKGKLTVTQTPTTGNATTYNFTKGAAVDYQGVYSKDGSARLIVGEGGYVANFNGAVQYGKMTKTGNTYSISIIVDGNTVTIPATVDSKGSLAVVESEDYAVMFSGLWVKGEFVKLYTGADGSKIEEFAVGENKTYIYLPAGEAHKYVTANKAIAENEIVTFTYDTNKTIIVKFTGRSGYVVAGAERGTYTASDEENGVTYTAEVDGFGTLTLSAIGLPEDQSAFLGEWTYRASSVNNKFVGNKPADGATMYYGFILDKTDNSIAFEEGDNYCGNVYTIMGNSSLQLSLTFDGFGTVIAKVADWNTTQYGTYVEGEEADTLVISGLGGAQSQFTDGTYTILQDGAVLSVENILGETEYWGLADAELPGPSVEVDLNDFVGYWVAPGDFGDYTLNITLDEETLVIVMDGSNTTEVTVNSDGTVTFKCYDTPYNLALNGQVNDKNTLKLTGEYIREDRVFTYTVSIPDAFVGDWLDSTGAYSLAITKTEVQIKLGADASLVDATLGEMTANSIKVSVDSVEYTITVSEQNLQIVVDSETITLTKAIITDSKWYGNWKNSDESIVLNITAGGITWNGTAVSDITLDVSGDLNFVYNDEDWTFEDYNGFTLKKGVYPSYEMTKDGQGGGGGSSGDAVQLDSSLEGTWVSTSDSTLIVVIDTTANTITYNGKTATNIRVDDSTTSVSYYFTVDSVEYNVYKSTYSSTITIEAGYDRTTFEKQGADA